MLSTLAADADLVSAIAAGSPQRIGAERELLRRGWHPATIARAVELNG